MLLKSHEAWSFIESIQDPINQKILKGFFTAVILRWHSVDKEANIPEHFDMLFYIETVYSFIERRHMLFEVLNGKLDYDDIPDDL
jgi:hypothetical protein